VFKRGTVNHVTEAANFHHTGKPADLVVNCTGLSSYKLGGVSDKNVYPGRGQIVLVAQEADTMTTISGTDDGPDEATYTMTRAVGKRNEPILKCTKLVSIEQFT
jgi:D-amino-acid oxidase